MKEVVKNYILFALQQQGVIVQEYLRFIQDNKICDIRESENCNLDPHKYYSKKIKEFLDGILTDEPFRQIHDFIQRWKKHDLVSSCNFHPILPDDIIKNQYMLNNIILSFLFQYTQDIKERHYIINEIDDIEDIIEEEVHNGFREMQMKAFQID